MASGDGGLKKNSEISTVLQSHNMLPARCLKKNDKASIYNNAEIGKVEGRNVFEEFDRGFRRRDANGCGRDDRAPERITINSGWERSPLKKVDIKLVVPYFTTRNELFEPATVAERAAPAPRGG